MRAMREKLDRQFAFRATEEMYETIQAIARRERRRPNEVTRALLEKGIEQYKRDLTLFEPPEDDPFLSRGEIKVERKRKGRS